MLRREDKSTFQQLPIRESALGGFLFFASVALVTFLGVSTYLDRAALSKHASRAPIVIEPIRAATPAASSIPAQTSPIMRPASLPPVTPPAAPTTLGSRGPTRSPWGGSTAKTPGVGAAPLVYGEQRQENFGR